jgi:uncharacterized membrane protein
MLKHHTFNTTVEGTTRVEAFSDAVYAIIITLLVLELRVPILEVATNQDLLGVLHHLIPEFIAFIFSFFIVAIYWVNHHHFFHNIKRADGKLLWHNNFHLFWMAIVPFTTAFIGKYYESNVAVIVYSINMIMCALSIILMIRYALFSSTLLRADFTEEAKKSEFNRGMRGVYLYVFATLAAFVHVYLAIAILIITPILFVIPRVLPNQEE